MTTLNRTLSQALTHGRVTPQTANASTIQRAVRLGLLAPGDLAEVYVLTKAGQCRAGDPPF